MSITREIFKNLNESAEIKKPYGDKPEEGKKEKLQKGKRTSVPKAKGNFERYKARKLEAKNKNAETIYANDTDKVMDKIDSTEHSDKGKIAKINGKKSEKTIKFPFGNKVEQSDSKLIKEGEEPECCKDKITEDYDNGTWMKYQNMIEGTLESAKKDMDEDAFQDFCDGVINLVQNYTGVLNQFECDKSCKKDEYNVPKDSKLINESSNVDHVFDYDIAKRFYDKYKSDKIGADFIMDYCSSKAFGKCNNELDPKSIDINSVQKELDGIVNSKKRK